MSSIVRALEPIDHHDEEDGDRRPANARKRAGGHAPEAKLAAMEDAIRLFLAASGVPHDDPHLAETPRRVARAFGNELLHGYQTEIEDLFKTFQESHDPLVVVRDIPFYSLCAHHMLPFYGTASIGYQPNGRVIGLSKLARLVTCLARRLQVQERLTGQILDEVQKHLLPLGVAVHVRAEHMCMSMRGVCKPGSATVTYAAKGEFETNPKAGERMFELLTSA